MNDTLPTAPLDIGVVGWHSHNQMFDEIGAELRKAGHRIVRYARSRGLRGHARSAGRHRHSAVRRGVSADARDARGAPRLRAIVSAVTGVDGIDMAAATEHARGRRQRADRGEHHRHGRGDGAADARRALRSQRRAGPRPARACGVRRSSRRSQLRGKTIGLVGLGRIGRETARLLAPWGATLQYSARRDADLTGLPPMPRVDLDTLLRTSDVVVVLASLNAETRGLIGAEKLRLMKKTAILVNTARGAIVDEAALAEALKQQGDRGRRARLLRGRAAAGRQPAARAAERDPHAAHDRPHHRGASFAGGGDARESRR